MILPNNDLMNSRQTTCTIDVWYVLEVQSYLFINLKANTRSDCQYYFLYLSDAYIT